MSRRRKATRRTILPDSLYRSALVTSLINTVMKCGKKSVAERIVYGAMEIVSEKLDKSDPVNILLAAMENARPKVEVKNRRVGGANYPVPVEISFERQLSLALRWLVDAADGAKGVPMMQALANILIETYNNQGPVVKQKETVHSMALANKAFAHLRW